MPNLYVPILKWKRGEQLAVANLWPAEKPFVYPVFELVEVPDVDASPDAAGRGPLFALVQQVARSWGGASPFAFDLEDFDTASPHPVDALFAEARAQRLQAIPVTSTLRSAGHQAAVARVIAADQRGAVLRLGPEELFDLSLVAQVNAAVTAIGVAASQVDVICDLGFIGGQPLQMVASAASAALAALSGVGPWRNLVIAASSFPPDLQAVQGVGRIARAERALWLALQTRARAPSFGDYAVAYPVYSAVPYAGAANIRYTIADDWLILRGRRVTGPGGYAQFVTLSQSLVQSPEYCGASFSWADGQIAAFAQGGAGTGNMTTWRAIGTNHHITFVVRQLFGVAPATAPTTAPGSPAGGIP